MRRLWPLALVVLTGCSLLTPIVRVASPTQMHSSPPDFASTIEDVSEVLLPHSWRPGCPVPLADLRHVTVTYWGFDDVAHRGQLVVHADHAAGIVSVMERLYAARFPIEQMELIDAYGGDDDASMAANNTSAFNCREVSRRPGVWSQHAFGTAIDVNPVQNPYILRDGTVLPPGAVTDRQSNEPGMVISGDVVVEAFASIGWGWGGDWEGVKDYQHFSASGR